MERHVRVQHHNYHDDGRGQVQDRVSDGEERVGEEVLVGGEVKGAGRPQSLPRQSSNHR